ncbi:tRNA preQ1(34) S-adenosylmethionine ribosyltransferase-isomerase QueA [Chlorogloea sp. CCALA 695]|uniref:tRNA preQ1(34) S-adenosylmethionine ribosyltransferase-isomerase QueA n=1 Tax=Chlorogloea sp. CCALA 695 TaxID=2107693 RepID=UPI000D077C73|nr:tRNA preQ1(34) S-adenosylmethionine ribosyltransferase-isomerase QueA [Chlorogloea sp. CCALA 695]PSB35357.1 tRNA preQ1(34) S-adenosylmethionine ribosyltransferase-isomerase QueA [Chlorogloea sp. CCALA 695]
MIQDSNPTLNSLNFSDSSLASYDYRLPLEQIAQNPAFPRDSAKLLVVNSSTDYHHGIFSDLPSLLQPGDLLIMNDTRVIPARLYGRKTSGAAIEVLLLEEKQTNTWLALVKPGKRLQPGVQIVFVGTKEQYITATVLEIDEPTGGRLLKFDVPNNLSLLQVIDSFGKMPLPPYITNSQADDDEYQTVYAQNLGAIASPTAGLHFTPELIQKLAELGINSAFVTLHVGVGTFRPVEVEDVTTHKMHGEWIDVSQATVEQIRATKAKGGRIIAVGTTAVRALEGAAAASGQLKPFCGKTHMFIYPGYQWRVVDGLITNFHLPRSSLLMLVSALIGRQRLLDLYEDAIAQSYRFYSFGDAMLILPEATVNRP